MSIQLERFVAAFLLALLSGPLLFVAVLILLTDGAPVFFKQVRIGQYGRPFILWKFRTMRDVEEVGASLTLGNDARVTRLGSWLRHTHIDELPQLLCIFRGEMSFIGPRPEIPEFVDLNDPLQSRVLQVRPGLVDRATLARMWVLRRILSPMGTIDALEFLADKLRSTRTNAEFWESMNA